MKNALLFFTFLSFCTVGYSQEEPTTLEKLESCQWTVTLYNSLDVFLNYDATEQHYTAVSSRDEYHESKRFYLSDEPEWIFDESKLRTPNGEYIIVESENGELCIVKKILGLAHQTLQIKYIKDPNDKTVWIGNPTAKCTYKGIPK